MVGFIGYLNGAVMLVKFDIYRNGDHWCAKGIGEDIFTQAKTLDELRVNIHEAVWVHFEDRVLEGEEIRILSISESKVDNLAEASSC